MNIDQIAVSIIAFAGDSQSYSKQAIEYARNGNYEKCNKCIKSAKKSMLDAHQVHTQLLSESAANEIEVNFLLVHASNHLSVAETMLMMAELFIEILREERGRKKC